ncbi:MAG: hypothetical protein ABR907_15850 [Terracidiphilus sp.]|jgi:hypothetical protein
MSPLVVLGIDITRNSTQLVVTSPPDIVYLSVFGIFTVIPLIRALVKSIRSGHVFTNQVQGWLIFTLLVYGFVFHIGQLTLDRNSGIATLRRFSFYYWSTKKFPVSALSTAYVQTFDSQEKIQLLFTDGHHESLDYKNQVGGKTDAAYIINQFLQEYGRGSKTTH